MSSNDSSVASTEHASGQTSLVSVGGQLRAAREQAGLEIEELASRLCMTAEKLRILEQDDFDRLAGAIYVRGYIRNACKELGLDAEPLLDAFAQQSPGDSTPHIPEMPRGMKVEGSGAAGGESSFRPLVLVLAIAAAGGYWWFGMQGGAPAQNVDPAFTEMTQEPELAPEAPVAMAEVIESGADVQEPTADAVEVVASDSGVSELESVSPVAQPEADAQAVFAPAVVADSTVSSGSAQELAASSEPKVAPEQQIAAAAAEPALKAEAALAVTISEAALSLSFSEEAWIEVVDAAGNKLLSRLQPAGSTVELTGEAPFNVMMGNAAATTVSYAGEVVDSAPLGTRRTRKLIVGG
ncbi:hypothetical protein Mag101_13105 [Microbulbifer agarilyticus]|uniref:Cytoskeleton protein RodZ-like C-terminal domain-containing protein n=1 Tax=Microbulbifer agarilyticus TaxID=260552 RepID=A0A1Q2M712_9GAMM|nr:RodZ domain-containing protein [Microbulbifer agarilyticus]AQQ68466.1 hypothetical protein Mag101_13105 [Microbulbifer agarilyticus]